MELSLVEQSEVSISQIPQVTTYLVMSRNSCEGDGDWSQRMMVLCCFFIGVVVCLLIILTTIDFSEDNDDTEDDADSGGSEAPSRPIGTSGSRRVTAAPRPPASTVGSETEIVQVSTLPITLAIKTSSVATSARMPTTTTTSARTRAPTATTGVRITTPTTAKTTTGTTTKGSTAKSTRSTSSKSTRSTTTKSTTTATTTKGTTTTPSTTTEYISTVPPVTNKPLPLYSFICTVDCIKTIFLPEDGLCDFMFFESLYRICGGDIGETQLSSALTRFVMRAKTAKKTQYGVSIHTPMIQDFMKHLANQQSLAWVDKELWKNNVYHWGIMTIHEFHLRANSDVLKDALAALKAAALFSKPSPTKTAASYTFIGFLDAHKSCDIIGMYAQSLFTPDAMVVLGHIAFDENKVPGFSLPCFVIPPNCIEPPASFGLGRNYSHSVEDAAFQVSCLRGKYNIKVPISVSLTLQGRWYEPTNFVDGKQSTGKYVYTECNVKTFTQEDDPLEICDRPGVVSGSNIKFDQKARSVVYFDDNPGNRRTFIFDNSYSLRYKVCVMKRRTVNVTYGIAAYDVNFDSGPTSCNESLVQGKYARTRQLKRLLPFIAYNYTDPQNLAACRNIT